MKFLKRLIGFIAVLAVIGLVIYKFSEHYEETKYIKVRTDSDIRPF